MTSSNGLAWNMKHILLNNLGSKDSLVTTWPVYLTLQRILFYQKKYMKNVASKLVSTSFKSLKNPL